MSNINITGIILAGGKSSRMGSEKGLIQYQGKAMIVYAIELLKPLCNELLISANSDAYHHLGYQVVADEIPDAGPMGGIYSCMKQAKNEVCLVLSCDMPLIQVEALTVILEYIADFDAALPRHGDGFYEPLCAAYRKSLIPAFEKRIRAKTFKMLDLIKNCEANILTVSEDSKLKPSLFYNINSKKDLMFLEDKINTSNLKNLPKLLLIAGTGRNVGKTSFVCRIIGQTAKSHEVVAVKVSPHLHQQDPGQKVLFSNSTFQIIEEGNPTTSKDSSRMLRAGASRVFYLQTIDKHIREPFEKLLSLIPENEPVICESGALLDYARPGLFVIVKHQGQTAHKKGIDQLAYLPDGWVEFDGEGFSPDPERFIFDKGAWKII